MKVVERVICTSQMVYSSDIRPAYGICPYSVEMSPKGSKMMVAVWSADAFLTLRIFGAGDVL